MARRWIWIWILLAVIAAPALAADPAPETLAEAGHWKRLRVIAEKRLAANPNDAQAAYFLARVKESYGDFEGALPLAEKAAALDGRNSNYHYLVGALYGQMARKASLFKQMSLAGKFKKETQTALELDPKNIDALWAMMDFYREAPGIMGGDKKKTAEMAEQIARINATRGYLARAELIQNEKEKDQAKLEELYRKAVEADPRSYEAQMTLAFFYGSDAQKKYDLAEKHTREALKLDPGRAGAYAGLAQLYAHQQRWQELDAILAQGERNVPDNMNPYYQAGRILLTDGNDLPRAERYFRKYLTQEPEGNTPHLFAAHWRLGQALEKQGRKPEAIAEMETAVKLEPNFEPAKKDLKRLKG